jgi:pyridoxine 5-phosphate synthase
MTNLSINLNKIALLRNSRGRDYPNLVYFAEQFVSLGAHGLTIHPRQDERHITKQDAIDLSDYCRGKPQIELNIEGYPSQDFLQLVEQIKPEQCTLVPDSPDQLTSDHGWNLNEDSEWVKACCQRLNRAGIRSAIFVEPDVQQIKQVPSVMAQRVELYTESFAASYGIAENDQCFRSFQSAAKQAQELGIGVNAGHDLDLNNLARFLSIPNVLEVSIGHALMV